MPDCVGFQGLTIIYAAPADVWDPRRRAMRLAMLSSHEMARFLRLRSVADRDLFLASHVLVREALSTRADVEPADWQFEAGPHGRPEIAAPESDLRFSLSHTRGLAACVVSGGCEVGIDVEDASRRWSAGLAERVLSDSERHDLLTAPGGEQQTRFLEYWTLKEAYLKARGIGLACSLQEISFYRRDARWHVEFAAGADDDPRRWRFESWLVDPVHQAALAVTIDNVPGEPHPCDEHERPHPVARAHVPRRLGA